MFLHQIKIGIDSIPSLILFVRLTLYNIPIQEYSVQLTFRQDWLDPRLAYPNTDGKIC